MLLRACRVVAFLTASAAAAGCAHAHYPYPPPPGEEACEAPAGPLEPAAFPRRIGVQVQPLTPELREHFEVEADGGLLVAAVEPQSPAARAGLRAGDVIVRAEDRPVHEPDDLVDLLQRAPEGEPVELTVVRKGREERIAVTPIAQEAGPPRFHRPLPPHAGPRDRELRDRVRELESRVEALERELEQRRGD